jgi:ribose 1,5-bisphosphokinase PhnN
MQTTKRGRENKEKIYKRSNTEKKKENNDVPHLCVSLIKIQIISFHT